MRILETIKNLFSKKPPIINIQKEFKKRFGIDAPKISEYKLKNIRVYITHEFEAENYAKVFVLIEGEETPEVDDVIGQYIGLLTISVGRTIYYETFIQKL